MWIFLTRQGLLSTKYESKVRKGGGDPKSLCFFPFCPPLLFRALSAQEGEKEGLEGT